MQQRLTAGDVHPEDTSGTQQPGYVAAVGRIQLGHAGVVEAVWKCAVVAAGGGPAGRGEPKRGMLNQRPAGDLVGQRRTPDRVGVAVHKSPT
jgi:hypothetical protein